MSFTVGPHRARIGLQSLLLLLTITVSAEPPTPMASTVRAAEPRVLAADQLPADTRFGPLKGEQGDFGFTPAKSAEEWKRRADEVRRIARVSLGLWPLPTKSPLGAVVHGKIDGGDYTVEKVYFETVPGFFTTGNLYRPKGKDGKRPGVLCPHGHFPGGRFQDIGREAVRREIAQGAERFEDEGRSFMQSRCVQLARMGCVVFHYDMLGYADSVQLPMEQVHQYSRHRVKVKQAPATGFFSAAAESRLQNVMGVHTYQSIRALDFLTGLPDVDTQRIAVTGASGGGTQTFMLCAVDDRPLVSVPAVMVSGTRQGGCTCEAACGLRIGTYNIEFAALHAPKPMLLISADDHTRGLAERGFPELKQHYTALGGKDQLAHAALLHFPHNYNYVSRTAMYHFLNKHLRLGIEEPILESPYRRLTGEQLTVWDENHPKPQGGAVAEKKLLDWLSDDVQRQLAALMPRDAKSLARYRELVGGAVDALIRQRLPEVTFETKKSLKRDAFQETLGLLRYRSVEGHQSELPVVLLAPKNGTGRTVIWLDGAGKAGLFDLNGSPRSPVRSLLDAGSTVLGVDLLDQGEFLRDGKPNARARALAGEEGFASWTYCYNLPPFAQRVHDVLAAAALAGKQEPKSKAVDLVAVNGAGPWAVAALARGGNAFSRAAIDTHGFRFASLTDAYDPDFLPGAVKYGDLPGILALAAPVELWLAGEGKEAPQIIRAAYGAAGAADKLTIYSGDAKETAKAATAWLLQR
jgi:dienelactone hydrolase